MKPLRYLFTLLLVATAFIGQAQNTITFDFEASGAYRASGNNSYTSSGNTYSQNGVSIVCLYTDIAATGSPISGKNHAIMRVAKNTTNSPSLTLKDIDNEGYRITSLKYKRKGPAAFGMKVEYSTDNTSWTAIATETAMPTQAGNNEITGLDITGAAVSIRFTVSVGSTTSSNRDANLDDIIITREQAGGKQSAGFNFASTTASAVLGEQFIQPELVNPNNITVTYFSSDNSVATVDAESGSVTLAGAGTTTITATSAEDNTYNAGTASYTLTVTDPNGKGSANNPYTVAEARAAIDAGQGVTGVYAKGIVSEIVTAYSSQYGNITYNISDDGTTTAPQLQSYRGKSYDGAWFTSAEDIQVGDQVVVYGNLTKYSTTYEFAADNQLVSLYRENAKQPADLSFDETSFIVEPDAKFTPPALNNPHNLQPIVWTSSDENIAIVGDGKVLVGSEEGTTTITAYFAGNDEYLEGSASYTITVRAPLQPGTAVYRRVSSDADITEGQYLIVYEDGSLAFDGSRGGTDNKLDAAKNTISVTITNGEIPADVTTDASSFTLIATTAADTYHIKSASGYYIGQTTDANGLAENAKTTYDNAISYDANSSSVNIVSGKAYLRYNATKEQERFRYLKSSTYTSQKAIALYKRIGNDDDAIEAPTFDPEGGEVAYGTMVTISQPEAALIVYTTDGTTPSFANDNGEIYEEPIEITKDMTIKAVAVADDEEESEVATAVYTVYVPATVTTIGFATMYYSNLNLTVPEGVAASAYVVSGGKLQPSKTYEENDVIPAGTAVVVEAKEAVSTPKEFAFKPTTEQGDAPSANMLHGSDNDMTDNQSGYAYYILTLPKDEPEGEPGFYWQPGTEGQSVSSAAHKAYLKVPAEEAKAVEGFTIGGSTTGISTIDNHADSAQDAWWTLDGRKLTNAPMQKGVYIHQGRKVVVK